jgi:hypothetical protein
MTGNELPAVDVEGQHHGSAIEHRAPRRYLTTAVGELAIRTSSSAKNLKVTK